jgi:hypothetical protein
MIDSKDKNDKGSSISIVVDGKFIGTDLEQLSKNRFLGMNFDKLLSPQTQNVRKKTFRIFLDKRGLILLAVFVFFVLVCMGLLYYFLNK